MNFNVYTVVANRKGGGYSVLRPGWIGSLGSFPLRKDAEEVAAHMNETIGQGSSWESVNHSTLSHNASSQSTGRNPQKYRPGLNSLLALTGSEKPHSPTENYAPVGAGRRAEVLRISQNLWMRVG